MSTHDSKEPETDQASDAKLRERLLTEIPEITVDPSSIYRRGRQLRTRRRLVVSAGALASIALVGVVAWTAAFRPLAPAPPAGTGDTESSQQTSQSTPSPIPEETQTQIDEPGDTHTDQAARSAGSNDDALLAPQIDTDDLDNFAAEHDLTIEHNFAERNMVDAGLVAQDGSMILITVSAATAEQTFNALETAISERDYQQVEIDGLRVYQQDQDSPGTPIHWLVIAGPDYTEFISIQANPAGAESEGNQIPTTTVNLVEHELLPFIITSSNA